jgi:hypothetical protein
MLCSEKAFSHRQSRTLGQSQCGLAKKRKKKNSTSMEKIEKIIKQKIKNFKMKRELDEAAVVEEQGNGGMSRLSGPDAYRNKAILAPMVRVVCTSPPPVH